MSNKRKKRANGEGCIRKLPDGRWEARITDGYTSNGKQHFKTFSAKTQAKVIERLNEFKRDRDKFNLDNINNYTVKEWLKIWYDDYVVKNVKVSTRTSYEGIINNHLIPNIGSIKLVKLKKEHIEKMYSELLDRGKKGKGLSVKSVKNIHIVLHKALKDAYEREIIFRNPASIAKVPTMKNLDLEKHEIEVYSKEEQTKLVNKASKDMIYGPIIIFALYTGMRRGEILGLQWSDIDFENRKINICKQLGRVKNYDNYDKQKTILEIRNTTKTSNSTRTIPMSNTVFNLLNEQYERQTNNKKILKRLYHDKNMVFCKENGDYIDPDTLFSKYKNIIKKADIKSCTFHALRHTFATRALESKVLVKVVSEMLGHSSVQFTLDTYTHVLTELQEDEMTKLEAYLNSIVM